MLAAYFSVLVALVAPAEAPPAAETLSPPRAAFARFKGLAGRWTGVSTKGWTEDVTFRTIAGGSTVVESSFNAHPDETMLTLFAMDGERLRLTHYCVAKNQPRMEEIRLTQTP